MEQQPSVSVPSSNTQRRKISPDLPSFRPLGVPLEEALENSEWGSVVLTNLHHRPAKQDILDWRAAEGIRPQEGSENPRQCEQCIFNDNQACRHPPGDGLRCQNCRSMSQKCSFVKDCHRWMIRDLFGIRYDEYEHFLAVSKVLKVKKDAEDKEKQATLGFWTGGGRPWAPRRTSRRVAAEKEKEEEEKVSGENPESDAETEPDRDKRPFGKRKLPTVDLTGKRVKQDHGNYGSMSPLSDYIDVTDSASQPVLSPSTPPASLMNSFRASSVQTRPVVPITLISSSPPTDPQVVTALQVLYDRDAYITSLKNQVSSAQSASAALNLKIAVLENHLSGLESSFRGANEQVQEKESQLGTLEWNYTKSENERTLLQRSLKDKEDTVRQQDRRIKELQDRSTLLERRLEENEKLLETQRAVSMETQPQIHNEQARQDGMYALVMSGRLESWCDYTQRIVARLASAAALSTSSTSAAGKEDAVVGDWRDDEVRNTIEWLREVGGRMMTGL